MSDRRFDDALTLNAMRRFVSALRAEREGFASELLAAQPQAQTVSAHLFVDAFLEQVEFAVSRQATLAFVNWFDGVLAQESPLRPPAPIARALPNALAQAARAHGFEQVVAEWVRQIDRRVNEAFPLDSDAGEIDRTDAMIDVLLEELDLCDPVTGEHSRAVGSWCARIARALGLDEAAVVQMRRAGLVHDIGKGRIPVEILTAARGLDDAEWEIVRRHVVSGDQIAAQQPLLEPYRSAIYLHHERLDGSGYPQGLRGEEIPLQARIVAVADSFNAMIGRRPYRSAYTLDFALDELFRGVYVSFDPEIVRALASVLNA